MSALRSRLRLGSLLVFGGVAGAASSLSVACADDAATPSGPAADAAVDVPSNADVVVPADAGDDPDARGPFNPADVPVACDASPCATQLVAGREHFCARMNDGTVRCWGHDAYGAIGTNPKPDRGGDPKGGEDDAKDAGGDAASTVKVVPDLEGVAQISAAGATTCARLDDGKVKCWGDNRRAQLGLAKDPPVVDEDPHPTPAPVALDEAATRVEVGHGIACASLASGKLWCWGKDDQAQLARPGGDAGLDPLNPVRGPGFLALDSLALTRLAIGDYTMLGLDAQGQVWSWGAIAGELGTISGRIASVSPNPTPKRIESLTKVTSLVASVWVDPPFDPPPGPTPPKPPPRGHACAIASGEVYCWGRSYAGALCTGLPDREQEPARALFDAPPKAWPQQLAVGDEITCARMTDGSIHCCGSDTGGRLGTGNLAVLSASFTKADAFTRRAVQVAASDRAVCALVEDGTVECWGSNERGELGVSPDHIDHPSPVRVSF